MGGIEFTHPEMNKQGPCPQGAHSIIGERDADRQLEYRTISTVTEARMMRGYLTDAVDILQGVKMLCLNSLSVCLLSH